MEPENGRKKGREIKIIYKPLTLTEYKRHISGLKNNFLRLHSFILFKE